MRIGPKIIISYFLLLLVVFSVTAFSFRFLSQVYLIREAKTQLKAEGQVIAELLQNIPLESAGLGEALLNRKQLRIAGRFLDSHLVVFNRDGKVIYTNLEAADRQQFIKAIQNNTERIRGYVVERVPVYTNRGESKGQILLLTKLKDLEIGRASCRERV